MCHNRCYVCLFHAIGSVHLKPSIVAFELREMLTCPILVTALARPNFELLATLAPVQSSNVRKRGPLVTDAFLTGEKTPALIVQHALQEDESVH